MTAALFEQIQTAGGSFRLAGRSLFRLTGADRVRYLNGQVTNDIRNLVPGSATYALVTDHKAHILADIYVHAEGDALLVDAEAHLREALSARLERYIIADDVEVTDLTEDFQLWHAFGPASVGRGSIVADRVGEPGIDFWLPSGAPEPHFPGAQLSDADFEALRILRHIPRNPAELNETTFPAEVGLQARAISFSKGCYIGQEVISRIQSTGKMPRTLVTWSAWADCDPAALVGQTLSAPEAMDKIIGSITSATTDPRTGRPVGLGFLKQSAGIVDSALLGCGAAHTIKVSVRPVRPYS